jgi:hypothetical protein
MKAELLRMRHDWADEPGPVGDSARFIVRTRLDGEPGAAIILAETDIDYRIFRLEPYEVEAVIEVLQRGRRGGD